MPRSPQELYEKMAVSGRDGANKRLGKEGENAACRYLEKQGYKIIERNFRNPFGEVDIIAGKGDVVAFIEVKTRLTDEYGTPSEAVTETRKRKYIAGANYYFAGKEPDVIIRFDVIEIFRGELNHIENAFC